MEKHLKTASLIAHLLDNRFSLFGMRFGLNGLLGLIPGAGDIVTAALSMHLIWIAIKLKMPVNKIIVMLWNVLVNFVVGLVPVLGDYLDFFTRANLKNLRIIQEYAGQHKIIEGEILSPQKEY